MKPFYLNRKEDHTGISGTGIVARGLIFPSGKCVMEWQTKHTSVAVYDSIEEVRAIHGHDGKTEVVVCDVVKELKVARGIASERIYDDCYALAVMDRLDDVAVFFGAKKPPQVWQNMSADAPPVVIEVGPKESGR